MTNGTIVHRENYSKPLEIFNGVGFEAAKQNKAENIKMWMLFRESSLTEAKTNKKTSKQTEPFIEQSNKQKTERNETKHTNSIVRWKLCKSWQTVWSGRGCVRAENENIYNRLLYFYNPMVHAKDAKRLLKTLKKNHALLSHPRNAV